ncbi:hypothetical protein [Methanothrix sp.]|jgi:hypothetical protein|uniref:hypothetical protein n=1 Tax=Methanothrix sp. TaxID=90426 RepID=UPI0032AFA3A9
MADEDQAVLEHFIPFCPKCGNECENKDLRRALDADNWKKIVIETPMSPGRGSHVTDGKPVILSRPC